MQNHSIWICFVFTIDNSVFREQVTKKNWMQILFIILIKTKQRVWFWICYFLTLLLLWECMTEINIFLLHKKNCIGKLNSVIVDKSSFRKVYRKSAESKKKLKEITNWTISVYISIFPLWVLECCSVLSGNLVQ